MPAQLRRRRRWCLVLAGALGIWALIDFIVILVGSFRDKQDKRLVNW